jgi:hypothetical protein
VNLLLTVKSWLPWFSAAASPFLGVLAYKWRAKVDTQKLADQASIGAAQAPISVLMNAIAQRDKLLTETNARLDRLMSDHFAHLENDQKDRERLTEVMAKVEGALTAIERNQNAMRDEGARRSAEIHEDLESIHTRLTAIEVKTGLRGGAA